MTRLTAVLCLSRWLEGPSEEEDHPETQWVTVSKSVHFGWVVYLLMELTQWCCVPGVGVTGRAASSSCARLTSAAHCSPSGHRLLEARELLRSQICTFCSYLQQRGTNNRGIEVMSWCCDRLHFFCRCCKHAYSGCPPPPSPLCDSCARFAGLWEFLRNINKRIFVLMLW